MRYAPKFNWKQQKQCYAVNMSKVICEQEKNLKTSSKDYADGLAFLNPLPKMGSKYLNLTKIVKALPLFKNMIQDFLRWAMSCLSYKHLISHPYHFPSPMVVDVLRVADMDGIREERVWNHL
jgi:hypothetical protein